MFTGFSFAQRAALLLLFVTPGAALAQPAAFTPEQREAIGTIVREYLIANPEVLPEAIAELERRGREAQKAAQSEVLADRSGTLLNPDRDFVLGNLQGDVTLVEFVDYNCPFCKKAAGDVKTLITNDPKLRVVLKDLPILTPESVEASRVALAARQQLTGDRQVEYHARLMESRGRVDGAQARAVAQEMGLDMARLEKELAGPAVAEAIRHNMALVDKLGLTGTPAFIIGGEVVPGAVGVEPLRQAIENVRACGKSRC